MHLAKRSVLSMDQSRCHESDPSDADIFNHEQEYERLAFGSLPSDPARL